jgi:hypothetical protein
MTNSASRPSVYPTVKPPARCRNAMVGTLPVGFLAPREISTAETPSSQDNYKSKACSPFSGSERQSSRFALSGLVKPGPTPKPHR